MDKSKQHYETPSTDVIEAGYESPICGSEVKGSSSINDWGNGGTMDDELYM